MKKVSFNGVLIAEPQENLHKRDSGV